MSDIQKCPGVMSETECGIRNNCKRFVIPGDEYQAWGNPSSDFTHEDGCRNLIYIDDAHTEMIKNRNNK